MEAEKQLTFGEKLVGLTFNPSQDARIDKAKRLCADLVDLTNDMYYNPNIERPLYEILFQHTLTEILNAQMNVVKLLTFKY